MSRSRARLAMGFVALAVLAAGVGFLVGRGNGRRAAAPAPPLEVAVQPTPVAMMNPEAAKPNPVAPPPTHVSELKERIPQDDIEKLNASVEKDVEELLSKSILEMEDEAAVEAYNTAVQKGVSAHSLEECAKVWEDYLLRYPLGPGAVQGLSRLGTVYMRMGEYDNARKALDQAMELNGNDPFEEIIAINQALVELHAGNLDKAEAMLTAVASRQVPSNATDPQVIAPIVFVAPMKLASVYATENNLARADEVLEKTYNRGLDILKEHNDWKWVASQIAATCQIRINLILGQDLEPAETVKKARELIATMEKDLRTITPSFGDSSYVVIRGDMDRTLSQYRSNLEYDTFIKELNQKTPPPP